MLTTRLNEITTEYNSFVNDQVLTASQLNTIIDYFEDQGRLTRISLIGVGLACGFEVIYNSTLNEITIQQGVGVTTDGDLIKLQKYDEELGQTINFEELKYKNFKVYLEDEHKYEPFFYKNDTQIDIWELVPEHSVDGEKGLDEFPSIEDKVVLLYLESYKKDAELCSGISCDDQGAQELAKLKVLLVSAEDADHIIENDSILKKYNIFETYENLPEVAVRRVILNSNNATSISALKFDYYKALTDNSLINNIKNGIQDVLTTFGYNTQNTSIQNSLTNLFSFTSNNVPDDFQYRYDLMKDIIDTYNELKSLFLKLNVECCPDINAFPKHLLIGKVSEPKTFKTYRHKFYKSPVTGYPDESKLFESLVERLTHILKQYSTSQNNTKITPSKINGMLENKSIPFYYSVSDALLDNWSFTRTSNYKQNTNLSYNTSKLLNNPPFKTPLGYHNYDYSFFRVEGHQQKALSTVSGELDGLIVQNGINFRVKSFRIGDSSLLNYLRLNYPEHKAGCSEGGTFILVTDSANKVVADFCLPYYESQSTTSDCCEVKTCSYPWISTLKYINNLTRVVNTDHAKKYSYYKLRISEYTIMDHQLVKAARDIYIPLEKVLISRMHIVASELNKAFPGGIVFDYDEQNKRMNITHFKKHQFFFTIQDITQNTKTPKYTYTEKTVLRDNKPYSYGKVICKFYDSSEYMELHKKYDPVGKDDDNFGDYYKEWERWNGLVRKLNTEFDNRYFESVFDIKSNIVVNNLTKIHDYIINNIDRSANIYFIGDWVNGTWVSPEMLRSSNPTVKEFVSLREKLHHKTGASDISLLIEAEDKNLVIDIEKIKREMNFNVNVIVGDSKSQDTMNITHFTDELI